MRATRTTASERARARARGRERECCRCSGNAPRAAATSSPVGMYAICMSRMARFAAFTSDGRARSVSPPGSYDPEISLRAISNEPILTKCPRARARCIRLALSESLNLSLRDARVACGMQASPICGREPQGQVRLTSSVLK